MAAYTFGTVAVYDPITDTVVENAVGGHLVAVKDGAPIPIYDLNDSPISQITSNGSGQSSQFKADVNTGLVQFGSVVVTVWANEIGPLAANSAAAVTNSAAAAAAAAASATAAQAAAASAAAVAAGGGGGGGTSLTDYSQVVALPGYPSVIAAGATALAARSAIGASDLQIGTTATTAKAGNAVPLWTDIVKPAFIAAGTTAALARSAIGFDAAARAATPFGKMWWNDSTATWWGYDAATNSYIDGAPRPNVPIGCCDYDAVLYSAATLPIGAQAMLFIANGPSDRMYLNVNSPLRPA